MSVRERDPLTGHETTGHEWNGITELNTRVPRAVWWAIGITHVWALIYWILMPSWPLITTYTKGLLGVDQQERVDEQLVEAQPARRHGRARSRGCRSTDPRRPGTDAGGDRDRAGALRRQLRCLPRRERRRRSGFPEPRSTTTGFGAATRTRSSRPCASGSMPPTPKPGAQMLAFGRDGMLTRNQVRTVVAYVRSLSGAEAPEEGAQPGRELFADNCASCHGEDATGSDELGAPDLTDAFWIYGGTKPPCSRHLRWPAWLDAGLGGPAGLAERKMLDDLHSGPRGGGPRCPPLPDRNPFGRRWRSRSRWGCGSLCAANAHLISVSLASQPACVPHLKPPQKAPGFRAANPSC